MLVSPLVTALSVPIDAIAADVRFLIEPAVDPENDSNRVAGLRLRRWHLMARTLVPPPLLYASHAHSESTAQTDLLTPS